MNAFRLLHMVARRGNARDFPENSLAALRSAIELGARFIEIDVHLSSDGLPMVVHDRQLARIANFEELPAAQLVRALKPVRSRCVLGSADLPTIHAARSQAGYPIAWVIPAYNDHTRLKYEALQPDFLFCDRTFLPAAGALWRGPWRWVVYEVDTLETVLALAARGTHFVGTKDVRSLSEAMRRHAMSAAGRDDTLS